jgi:hypothetical protein
MNEYPVAPCHTEYIIEDFKYTLVEGECTWFFRCFFFFLKKKLPKYLTKYC